MFRIIKIEKGADVCSAETIVYDVALAETYEEAIEWATRRKVNDLPHDYYVLDLERGKGYRV